MFPVGECDKDLGLQEYRHLGVEDVVMPTAAENQAKRDEGITIQKLTDVVADHTVIVTPRRCGFQEDGQMGG